MRDLSIIIVTYNPGDLIMACLASLEAACAGLDAEIMVVDNASVDGTVDRIKEAFQHVRLTANPDNRGFAAACNQGLAAATGRYLVLLNPDTVVESGALAALRQFMDSHPQTGILGPRVVDPQGAAALNAYPEFEPGMILWQYLGLDRVFPYHVFGRYRRQCGHSTIPFRVEWVQGSCLMLRREVYEKIGGLDETFFLFSEEPDFCQRARAQGWEVWINPAARVAHAASSTVSRYTYARVRNYHISPLIYFRKRQRPRAILILKLGFTIELAGKMALRLIQLGLGQRQYATHLGIYRQVMRELWAF